MKANKTLILYTFLIGILFVSCKKSTIAIGKSYQGGIIFYILQPGDIGYDANVQHGLIAQPNPTCPSSCYLPDGPWDYSDNSGVYPVINGADGYLIGTGAQNTIDIVNSTVPLVLSNGQYAFNAAYTCDLLELDGYTDWYLPSKDELNLLYLNNELVDPDGINLNWNNGLYWSSSKHYTTNKALAQSLVDGTQVDAVKQENYMVRAIRSF
jgi:hypothetical protein